MNTEPSYAHAIVLCRESQGQCLVRAAERACTILKIMCPSLLIMEDYQINELNFI